MVNLQGINVLKHSSIRISKGKIIYIDPFQIDIEAHDADLILCTHSHYDHFSPRDIKKVANEGTVLMVTKDCIEEAKKIGFLEENIFSVKPEENFNYEGILIETVPAYNKFKVFHPKKNNWVGYILTIDGIKYYIAGDTDKTKEACNVECDVAFLPVGGTYTMDYKEAASLCYKIKPKCAIPTHYGLIVGELSYGMEFKNLIVSKDIDVEVYF